MTFSLGVAGILFHILFRENFRRVAIIDGGDHQMTEEFMLLEQQGVTYSRSTLRENMGI
jgi:hypothetical protein